MIINMTGDVVSVDREQASSAAHKAAATASPGSTYSSRTSAAARRMGAENDTGQRRMEDREGWGAEKDGGKGDRGAKGDRGEKDIS